MGSNASTAKQTARVASRVSSATTAQSFVESSRAQPTGPQQRDSSLAVNLKNLYLESKVEVVKHKPLPSAAMKAPSRTLFPIRAWEKIIHGHPVPAMAAADPATVAKVRATVAPYTVERTENEELIAVPISIPEKQT